MTRKQKLILLAFAITDVAMIALLASIVVRSSRTTLLPPITASPIQVQVSPCEQRALDALTGVDGLPAGPQLAWSQHQLYLSFTVAYPDEMPPADSAQMLWTVLDNTASLFDESCPIPPEVIFAVTARGATTTVRHLAHIAGEDLEAWRIADLTDESLAARVHYRQVIEAVPSN